MTMMRTRMMLRAAWLAFMMTAAACGGNVGLDSGSATTSVAATTTTAAMPAPTSDPIAFSSLTYSISQTAGSVSLTVTRSGTVTSAASIEFATADGTAVAGTDYTAASGTLQWAENDATSRTITILLSNLAPYAGSKSFSVALSNPSSAAQMASPDVATVTISGTAAASPGSLQFSSANYSVNQYAGGLSVTVNRTGGSSGSVSVAYSTSDGTAAAGSDYTAASGTLAWQDGDASSKTFSVPVSTAAAFSGTKTFSIALSNASSGAALGVPSSAVATIVGSASAAVGSLQLSASSYAVSQSGGQVSVSVVRSGGSAGEVSVSYATTNGTAVAGADYTAASGTLTWQDGDSSTKSFSVSVSDAVAFAGNRAFTVALSAPGGGTSVSYPGLATVTISGTGSSSVGSLEFSSSGYTVAQSGGTAELTVERQGGSTGAVTVAYATSSGTAVAGQDFTSTSGTLSWAVGDVASKTISVKIADTTLFSGTRSFTVSLSAPGGGATLGNPTKATVTINGGASAAVGSLQLSASTYSVAQSGGSLTVTVDRTGGSSGAVSVAYATTSGTAIAGTNFTATSGTLSWAAGNTAAKTFTVPISNQTPFSGTKTFSIALSGPGGGATLSNPTSATVSITGSSSPPPVSGSGASWIYYHGKYDWAGDWNQVAMNYDYSAAGVDGSGPVIYMPGVNAYQYWLPYPPQNSAGPASNGTNFNTTGYTKLTIAINPSQAGMTPQIQFFVANGSTDDIPFGTMLMITQSKYGPVPMVPGQWNVYTIPLTDFGLAAGGQWIYKLIFQQQGTTPQNLEIDQVGFLP